MADGSRWILHNHVRTAPPIPIHLFKHISSDGEFTQRLNAATRRQRGRAFSSSVIPPLLKKKKKSCVGIDVTNITDLQPRILHLSSIVAVPASSPFLACNVVNCGSGEVCFTSFQGHAPLGLFSRLERARNFTPAHSSLIPPEWVLRKFQITGLFSSPFSDSLPLYPLHRDVNPWSRAPSSAILVLHTVSNWATAFLASGPTFIHLSDGFWVEHTVYHQIYTLFLG